MAEGTVAFRGLLYLKHSIYESRNRSLSSRYHFLSCRIQTRDFLHPNLASVAAPPRRSYDMTSVLSIISGELIWRSLQLSIPSSHELSK